MKFIKENNVKVKVPQITLDDYCKNKIKKLIFLN